MSTSGANRRRSAVSSVKSLSSLVQSPVVPKQRIINLLHQQSTPGQKGTASPTLKEPSPSPEIDPEHVDDKALAPAEGEESTEAEQELQREAMEKLQAKKDMVALAKALLRDYCEIQRFCLLRQLYKMNNQCAGHKMMELRLIHAPGLAIMGSQIEERGVIETYMPQIVKYLDGFSESPPGKVRSHHQGTKASPVQPSRVNMSEVFAEHSTRSLPEPLTVAGDMEHVRKQVADYDTMRMSKLDEILAMDKHSLLAKLESMDKKLKKIGQVVEKTGKRIVFRMPGMPIPKRVMSKRLEYVRTLDPHKKMLDERDRRRDQDRDQQPSYVPLSHGADMPMMDTALAPQEKQQLYTMQMEASLTPGATYGGKMPLPGFKTTQRRARGSPMR